MSSPTAQVLLDTSSYSVLAAAMLLLGMSTGAFTKAGKGKRAGAKAGFALTGLFLLSGTGMLIYVAIQIMMKQKQDDTKS